MRAALRLVWALDVRHLAAHRLRLMLSVVGIASGVALAIGVASLGSSIDATLAAISTAAASKANLEVRPNAQVGLDAQLLETVQALPGVERAGATVESYTKLRAHGRTERTLVLGIDLNVLAMAPEAVNSSAVRGADPNGVFLPTGLAANLGVRTGDEIEALTRTGWRRVRVGAVLPAASAGRGRVAAGGINVVRSLLGTPGRVDAIYVQAADPETTGAAIQRAIGTRGRVGPAGLRQRDFRQLMQQATTAMNAAALVALFVGAFLIYNTMAMAAVERMGEAALLRAVGARRRQVFALFVAEGGLLGAAGSVLGVVLGALLAAVSIRNVSLQRVGVPLDIQSLSLRPVDVAVAVAAGIAVAVAAAILPARRAARSDPAAALGPAGAFEEPVARRHLATSVAGWILFAGGLSAAVGLFQVASTTALTVAMVCGLAGMALLVPTAVPAVARVLLGRTAGDRSRAPGLVRLSAGEVLRSPGRTAYTAGAIFLALALVVGFDMAISAYRRTFAATFDQILRADLYVRSGTWGPLGSDVPLDASVGRELQAVPGVDVVYPFKSVTSSIDGRLAIMLAFDHTTYSKLPDLSPEWRAEARRYARLLSQPGNILISPSVPRTLGLHVGDTLDLPTPTGAHRVTVAGELPDPTGIPTLVFDYDEFSRLWGDPGADNFNVGLAPGADPAAVKAAIERGPGRRLDLQVDTRRQYQDLVNGVVGTISSMVSSVMLVAVLVAALGLANTLLISTLERRRDLGVLRAVGMLRRQVRRMVAVEALMVGAVGVVLAWGFGTFLGYVMFRIVQAQGAVKLDLQPPFRGYAIAAVLGMAGALVAALYPAHRAATVDVVDALHYE